LVRRKEGEEQSLDVDSRVDRKLPITCISFKTKDAVIVELVNRIRT